MVSAAALTERRHRLTRWVIRNLLIPYWQPQVSGLENLPPQGPLLCVGNHPTIFDAFVVAAVVPRRVDFLVAEAALRVPLIGPWLRTTGAISVGPDRRSIVEALRRLQEGGCVGIFPEGDHTHSDRLQAFHRGAAVLAQQSGAPVVPVAWLGATALSQARSSYVRGGTTRMVFGAPLRCGAEEELASFLLRLRQALQPMLDHPLPLPPLRRDWHYRLCQLIWIPTTWLTFKLADWARPGNRR